MIEYTAISRNVRLSLRPSTLMGTRQLVRSAHHTHVLVAEKSITPARIASKTKKRMRQLSWERWKSGRDALLAGIWWTCTLAVIIYVSAS